MFNLKIILSILLFTTCVFSNAQTLEFEGGSTGTIDLKELESIKAYAFDANTSITRLLNKINRLESESSIVNMKKELMSGISTLIKDSKDKRCILLLTHSLQAGMTLVNLIEKQSIEAGADQTPQGIVNQQFRILKQSLVFARNYYESDYQFINGVLTEKNTELKTNPKFVEFGIQLTRFILKMSNGITNVRSSYGMIRWSLAVLANYIKSDKNAGIAYASIRYNLVTELMSKNMDQTPVYPDLVNGEAALTDIQCILKTRDLKNLAKYSFEEMNSAKKELLKAN